jgi:hypothetical protein
MSRKHSERAEEHIRLDPRLQARLEEKKGRLDLHRPLAPAPATPGELAKGLQPSPSAPNR